MAKNSNYPMSASSGARAWLVALSLAAGVLLALAGWAFWGAPSASPAPTPTPILSSSSQELPVGHAHPPRALVDALFRDTFDENLVRWFDECRKQDGFEKLPVERWFVSVQLPPIDGQLPLYFVRPTLEPFCLTFYGAHTFSYWLVQQQPTALGPVFKVVDFDSGDFVHVLPTHHGGIYDLERGLCTAVQCTYATQQRQGDSFRLVNCRREHFDDGRLVRTEPLDCDDLMSN